MPARIDRAALIAARALVSGLDVGVDVSVRAEMLVELSVGDVELLRRACSRLDWAALERPTPLTAEALVVLTEAIALATSSGTGPTVGGRPAGAT